MPSEGRKYSGVTGDETSGKAVYELLSNKHNMWVRYRLLVTVSPPPALKHRKRETRGGDSQHHSATTTFPSLRPVILTVLPDCLQQLR